MQILYFSYIFLIFYQHLSIVKFFLASSNQSDCEFKKYYKEVNGKQKGNQEGKSQRINQMKTDTFLSPKSKPHISSLICIFFPIAV